MSKNSRTSFEGEFGFGERGGALGSPAWVLCILKILVLCTEAGVDQVRRGGGGGFLIFSFLFFSSFLYLSALILEC